ncbi:MAG: acetamidase/formamidase family protein [Candidatus Atribacteria bacterium]|nr:acetamidase/formamidase family protein [Candidatus Atribacteria bacterium]MCD6350313.1 acetamidase/formamidase family protein [Candidatus Atribacteria bacterium]
MKKVTNSFLIYEFSSCMDGVVECLPGEECVFETLDCFGGQVKTEKDDLASIDFSKVNPATGPVIIKGAKKGQLLKVEILEIKCFSPGIVATHPHIGVLNSRVNDYLFKMVEIDEEKCYLEGTVFPMQSMIGVIGVAPASGNIPTTTPGMHGGNMDTREICEGSVVYLPVFQNGAFLALGDVHAAMGDGEIGGAGVEVSAEVKVRVNLLENQLGLKSLVVETDRHFVFLYSASSLDVTFEELAWECSRVIQECLGWDFIKSYYLMSATCHFGVSQLVDPLLTVKAYLPKEVSPLKL